MIHEEMFQTCKNMMSSCTNKHQLYSSYRYSKLYMDKLRRDGDYSKDIMISTMDTFFQLGLLYSELYCKLEQ